MAWRCNGPGHQQPCLYPSSPTISWFQHQQGKDKKDKGVMRSLRRKCYLYRWDVLTRWPLGDLNVILKNVIFNLALLIGIFKSSCDNVLRWMPQDLTDDKSTLVQVMAWCRQATSHYLNQCWPRSPTPYGVTRPQWVNTLEPEQNCQHFVM